MISETVLKLERAIKKEQLTDKDAIYLINCIYQQSSTGLLNYLDKKSRG